MKLSEAILLGSVGTGQATGALLKPDGRTCALGAAFIAAGFEVAPVPDGASFNKEYDWVFNQNAVVADKAKAKWPILMTRVQHPVTGVTRYLDTIIQGLNDYSHWTRPRIAEWVATIEQQQEAKELNGGLVEKEVQLR